MKPTRTYASYILSLLFIVSTSMVASATSDSLVDYGWKQWNENKRSLVERSFLSAIEKDKKDARAYLGLALLYALQDQPEKEWPVYKQALDNIDNPYPYIFAALHTTIFRNTPEWENREVVDLLRSLTGDQKAPPIMRAMAYENLGVYYEQRHDLSKSQKCYDGMHAITDWMVLGAFDNTSACGYNTEFPPESAYVPSAVYTGKLGSPASWFKVNAVRRDCWIDFNRYFAYSNAVFYANTFVYSPVKQSIQFRVGTSGSLKAFLNDELILADQDENNNDLDTYIASTELQQGWNRVLIKCGYSEITKCNFMLRITGPDGEKVPKIEVSPEPHDYVSRPKASIEQIGNFAELFFNVQIKLHPDHCENYVLLADCYLRNDKAAEAEDVLRKGLVILPQCSLFYNSLIETYTRGEKKEDVGDIYEIMGTLDAKLPAVLTYRHFQFIENEQYDEAEQIIREIDTLQTKSELVYALYIGLYAKKKQIDKVIAYGEEAYERYPRNWELAGLRSQIALEKTRDFQPAVAIVNTFLEHYYSAAAISALADFYLRWGKLEQYDAAYADLLELDPPSPGYYRSMGNTYFQVQQYDKAIELFRKGLAICPSSATLWESLGNCYRALKKYDEAKKAFRQALLFLPTKYDSRESIRELEGKPPIFSSFQSTDIAELKTMKVQSTEFPDDGAVYLLDDTKRVVYPEGASESMREIAVKAFNSIGVDEFKEYQIGYNGYLQSLTVEKACVVKAKDQSEIKADVKDNHIVFKSFETGDMIYIKWHVKDFYSSKLSSHFWDDIYVNGFIPKKKARYSLLVPKNLPFKYNLQHGNCNPTIDTLQEGYRYTWTMYDLPSIKQEEDMSVLDDIGTILHISSLPDWNFIVQWYADIASDKTRSSFEIREQVAALFKDKINLTDDQKIKIIYNFITEKIRYSSVSFRQSSYIPQRARDVLVHRIGDCKDMATLCIAMLREVGIPAYHVLVNTRNEGRNQYGLPSLPFNHCIVGVKSGPAMKYIDLTASNYSMESGPFGDMDAFALVIKPGSQQPFYIPDSLFSPKNSIRTTLMTVNADNSVFIDRSSIRTGALAGSYRDRFRDKGKKDVEKEIISIITYNHTAAELKSYEFKNLDELEPTLSYRFSFTVPNSVMQTGGLKILKLEWADKLSTNEALSYNQRTYPYEYFPARDTSREEMTIVLPAGYVPVDLAPSILITSPFGKYSLTYSFSKGEIHGRRELINQKNVIDTSEYKEFRDFYNKVIGEDEKNIAFKKGK